MFLSLVKTYGYNLIQKIPIKNIEEMYANLEVEKEMEWYENHLDWFKNNHKHQFLYLF